jgi:hypothetical protein
MDSRSINVFFYGLFMDIEMLRARGLHPVNGRQACVPGMALRIGQRATLIPDPAKCVYGVVTSLPFEEIEQLYAEPSVSVYRPEAVIATLMDGSCIPALCFNLPSSDETVETNPDYAERLRVVANRLGLPVDYVTSIR